MTRIQTTFIFFFLLYSISAQSNAPSTPLNTAVNDLEIIARLVNGIAIQAELEKNPRKVDEIVAEFLGVSEGEHIRNLRNLPVDSLVEDLKLLFQGIETQIPNPTSPDIRKIVRTIESLSQFQSDVAILKPGGVPDPKTDLEGQLNSVKNNQSLRTAITEFFDEGHWIDTKKLLENFKAEDGQSAGSRTARSAIATLQSGFSKAQGYCGRLKMNSSTNSEFHPVLELITLKEKLRGVDALATLSEAYLRDIADFKALHVTLDPLKFDVTNFRASLTNLTSFKPIVQLTQRAQNLIETLTLASQGNANRKKNTNGFSRGISDVSLMFDDLNVSATMKKLVSRGKELTNMTIALTPMRSFLTKFQEVSAAWNETFNGSGRSNFSKMAKILEDTWNASEPILENLELESTITSAINCTRDLADPTSSWDPVAYQQVSDFGIKLIGKIEIFNETLESVTGLICDKLIIKSSELESLLTINKQSEAKDQWDLVRNWTELDSLIDIYSRINSTLTEGKLNSPIDVLDESWSLDEVPKVVESSTGTMLPETLECLNNTSDLVEGILEVEEFENQLRIAKSISISASNSSSMQAVYQHIDTMILVKQKMLEVQEVFEKEVALRLDLNDAESLSADLGSGVDSLRELTKMHAPDIAFKINNVIRAGTEINLIIDNISGVDQVWNNENRQLLNDILRELRELEQEVRTMKQDTMDQVWKVFERAEKRLKGHDIDSRVFGDPIAAALERAAKIYIRDVAKSFRAVAELDLNFAQHNVHLKAAHGTLQPIQKFFDLFFGNAEAIGDTTTSKATGNDSGAGFYWIILLSFVAVVSILAIIGTIAYRISEARLLKARRLDPERYWVYQTPQCHPTDATWLPIACFANKTDLVRKLVKDGQNVDTFYKGKSCLHWAITHQNPEMLELLIKHGADRSVQDKDFLDAKAALEAVISGKLSSEKVATPPATTGNAEKCAKVMRKYEKSKFLPYVPKLPPISSFSISICDDYHGSFAENYPKLCNEDGVFDIDEVAEVKKADLAEHDPKKPKISTLERIDMEMIEKRRRLVNLVFDFALMVDMKWLDECVKDKKAFYDDYEKYRVRKVKYSGKIYQSVDLWRKWMCDRAIPCLEDGIVYFHLAETKKSSCMTGETIGARVIENYSDAMIEAANRTGPAHLYWDPECSSMLIVQVDGVQSEDWFGNMQVFKNNTKQLVEDEYYQYLLEQTGVGKLDEEGAGKRGARGSNERKSSKKSSNESAASVQSTVELTKK